MHCGVSLRAALEDGIAVLLSVRSSLSSGPALFGKQIFLTWSKLLEGRVGPELQKQPLSVL